MFFYHLDESKYKIKANKGKTIECRFCSLKRNILDKGFTHRIDGKFEFVPMSKIEILKYVVSKL